MRKHRTILGAMEGLIKGLIDVALGHDDNRDEETNSSESREEQSRSTWAQVSIRFFNNTGAYECIDD